MNAPSIEEWPYCHKIRDKWYFCQRSQASSIQHYRLMVRYAYGDLRGVRLAKAGKDYDKIVAIGDHWYPTKDGRYI